MKYLEVQEVTAANNRDKGHYIVFYIDKLQQMNFKASFSFKISPK